MVEAAITLRNLPGRQHDPGLFPWAAHYTSHDELVQRRVEFDALTSSTSTRLALPAAGSAELVNAYLDLTMLPRAEPSSHSYLSRRRHIASDTGVLVLNPAILRTLRPNPA